jgi:hypothetical protein
VTPRNPLQKQQRRTSIFPAYAPPADNEPSFEHFATYVQSLVKRGVGIVSLLGLIGAGAAFLGFQVHGPKEAAARIAALEDTAKAHSRRIDGQDTLMRTNIYLTCEVLGLVQPARSIVPKECRK